MKDYLNRLINKALNLPPSVALSQIDDEGKYWITSDGSVLSVCGNEPKYLNTYYNDGYEKIKLNGNQYYIHRLLALRFNQIKEKRKIEKKCIVHHLDRDRNNNSLDNLCILTPEKHKAIHNIWRFIDKWEQPITPEQEELFPISEQ